MHSGANGGGKSSKGHSAASLMWLSALRWSAPVVGGFALLLLLADGVYMCASPFRVVETRTHEVLCEARDQGGCEAESKSQCAKWAERFGIPRVGACPEDIEAECLRVESRAVLAAKGDWTAVCTAEFRSADYFVADDAVRAVWQAGVDEPALVPTLGMILVLVVGALGAWKG